MWSCTTWSEGGVRKCWGSRLHIEHHFQIYCYNLYIYIYLFIYTVYIMLHCYIGLKKHVGNWAQWHRAPQWAHWPEPARSSPRWSQLHGKNHSPWMLNLRNWFSVKKVPQLCPASFTILQLIQFILARYVAHLGQSSSCCMERWSSSTLRLTAHCSRWGPRSEHVMAVMAGIAYETSMTSDCRDSEQLSRLENGGFPRSY